MKKRSVANMLVCLAMVMCLAAGCGSSDDSVKDIVTEESGESTGAEDAKNEEGDSDDSVEVTIAEQVLFDQEGIVITATEFVEDDIWGDGVKLLLENNSEKSVTVSCNALIVNNYMISDFFVADVAAGKKANEIMYLSSSELEAAGIDSVGQIEVYFHIYDPETYETILDADCVTIQTSTFAEMDTTPDDMGNELYNANGIRIVGKTVDENSFWGTAILLYCENASGRNVCISVEEMSINGFMVESWFSTTVYDGKMALDEITIFEDTLEENGIEEIQDVELKFHIYDADSYENITDSEVITFSTSES